MNAAQRRLWDERAVWLQLKAADSERTAQVYRQASRRFLQWLGDDPLTYGKTSQYRASLVGLEPSTVARMVSTARSFLRHCQERGIIDRSPIDGLKRPRVVVDPFSRYGTLEDQNKALAAAKEKGPEHFAVLMSLVLTGCRESELAAGMWKDLYYDPAGRLGWKIQGKGTNLRTVWVPDQLMDAFKALHPSSAVPSRDETHLVTGRRHGVTRQTIWRMVRQVVQASGIRQDASVHTFRHGYGSAFIESGGLATDLQRQLGHARLDTTMIYVNLVKGLDSSPTLTILDKLQLPS